MSKLPIIILMVTAFALILAIGAQIDSLRYRVTDLEQRAYPCSRGVAVMTPDGSATTVCAP
jgi:hypothetical protein